MTRTYTGHGAPALVVVRDIGVSWAYYLEAAPECPLPPHLLLHLAGTTPEGVRIVELWDSRPAWESFAGAAEDSLAELERAVSARASVIRTLDVSHTLAVTADVGVTKSPRGPDRIKGHQPSAKGHS